MSCFPWKQIKTKQNVNLCLSNTIFRVCATEQVAYVHFSPVKICHSARATTSQNSHYCVPVHSVQTSSFSKHEGGTVWAACQTAVLWREALLRINNTKPLGCPCRCLSAGRKNFLIFNVCSNELHVNPMRHHEVSHVDHKREELCLHNSIWFAFLPLLMTFIKYSLFQNCFQASSFLDS